MQEKNTMSGVFQRRVQGNGPLNFISTCKLCSQRSSPNTTFYAISSWAGAPALPLAPSVSGCQQISV